MPKRATEQERRAIQRTLCPGDIWVKGRKRKCDVPISYGAKYCSKCKTRFAEGALRGLRIPKSNGNKMRRADWAKRYGWAK